VGRAPPPVRVGPSAETPAEAITRRRLCSERPVTWRMNQLVREILFID
jgi:hypothetical protein